MNKEIQSQEGNNLIKRPSVSSPDISTNRKEVLKQKTRPGRNHSKLYVDRELLHLAEGINAEDVLKNRKDEGDANFFKHNEKEYFGYPVKARSENVLSLDGFTSDYNLYSQIFTEKAKCDFIRRAKELTLKEIQMDRNKKLIKLKQTEQKQVEDGNSFHMFKEKHITKEHPPMFNIKVIMDDNSEEKPKNENFEAKTWNSEKSKYWLMDEPVTAYPPSKWTFPKGEILQTIFADGAGDIYRKTIQDELNIQKGWIKAKQLDCDVIKRKLCEKQVKFSEPIKEEMAGQTDKFRLDVGEKNYVKEMSKDLNPDYTTFIKSIHGLDQKVKEIKKPGPMTKTMMDYYDKIVAIRHGLKQKLSEIKEKEKQPEDTSADKFFINEEEKRAMEFRNACDRDFKERRVWLDQQIRDASTRMTLFFKSCEESCAERKRLLLASKSKTDSGPTKSDAVSNKNSDIKYTIDPAEAKKIKDSPEVKHNEGREILTENRKSKKTKEFSYIEKRNTRITDSVINRISGYFDRKLANLLAGENGCVTPESECSKEIVENKISKETVTENEKNSYYGKRNGIMTASDIHHISSYFERQLAKLLTGDYEEGYLKKC